MKRFYFVMKIEEAIVAETEAQARAELAMWYFGEADERQFDLVSIEDA